MNVRSLSRSALVTLGADGMHSGERVKEARQSTHPVDLTVSTLS
jgi:hypothetical protein